MRWVQIAVQAAIVWIELRTTSSTGVDRSVCGVGEFDSRGQCVQCPGGTFGALPGLTNSQCSGKCSGGFFCPPGSTSARQQPCGSSNLYCPPGSAAPLNVNDGFYTTIPQVSIAQEKQHPCEPGYFCTFGIRRPCPAGTFGNTPRLATAACSRTCPAGFYCPEGTDEPLPCPPGTFGADKGLTTAACSGLCPLGRYCESTTVTPRMCPPGVFGASLGLTTRACSSNCSVSQGTTSCMPSPCPPGYYCPPGVTAPLECGSVGTFCPTGSMQPTNVSVGFYTTWRFVSGEVMGNNGGQETLADQYIDGNSLATQRRTTRTSQMQCEAGSYCVGGVKKLCLAGVYGDSQRLSTAACTAPCPAGYYCPIGSTNYRRHPCTAKDVYCRLGSSQPSRVSPGYFTVASASNIRVDQIICPRGSFCVEGVAHLCPPGTFGATTGLQSSSCSGRCQDGNTCPLGSVSATQLPCPSGSYATNGVSCAPCAPGFWCTIGSPSREQHECGADTTYCPLGSSTPIQVSDGYFATGQSLTTHTSAMLCTPRNAAHVPKCPTRTVGVNAGL